MTSEFRAFYNIVFSLDWLFSTQSRVLQADWLVSENNGKATLNINMPYYSFVVWGGQTVT